MSCSMSSTLVPAKLRLFNSGFIFLPEPDAFLNLVLFSGILLSRIYFFLSPNTSFLEKLGELNFETVSEFITSSKLKYPTLL